MLTHGSVLGTGKGTQAPSSICANPATASHGGHCAPVRSLRQRLHEPALHGWLSRIGTARGKYRGQRFVAGLLPGQQLPPDRARARPAKPQP
ncbi:hypothetical protein C4K40_2757 [Pseudomonas sp. CMR5c]|nr:hypothetical protein C4K40_2757 [Pseudomonas sp. CMR5c]